MPRVWQKTQDLHRFKPNRVPALPGQVNMVPTPN